MVKARTAKGTGCSITRKRGSRGRASGTPVRDKELAFAREYAQDWNKTQAAIRAGYSKASARYIGYELLKKPHIQKMVQDIQRERAARLDLDALWLKDQMKDCYVAAREKGDLKSAARLLESLGKLIGAFGKHNDQKYGIKTEAEANALREKLRQRGMSFNAVNAPSGN